MATTTIASAAFLSYARFSDQQEQDRITELCKRLADEVENLTGYPFKIFQDTRDIRVGQPWKTRVEETINSATLLIAIITPSFFTSEYCRSETEQFLERERKLGRNDLIIPVHYISVRAFDRKEPDRDRLVELMKSRELSDWRNLRFEALDAMEIRRAVNKLASQIEETLQGLADAGVGVESPETAPQAKRLEISELPNPQPAPPAEQLTQTDRAVNQPEAITVHVVDALRGPHRTLAGALTVAKAGDRILVRPGTYDEGLVLDTPFEIIGEGKPEEIIIQTKAANVLAFRATLGRVGNITLRQLGGADYFAVDIAQGRLTLEGCRIESDSLAGIAIHGAEAAPIIRNNLIHRCRKSGVVIFDHARGTLEENDITDNDAFGVVIRDEANPVLRANQIHDNESGGVFADGGHGQLDDNAIFKNRGEGVLVANQGNPVFRNNRINKNAKAGVYVYDNGSGTVEGNKIFENRQSGVAIRAEGHPIVQDNSIRANNGKGVWCKDRAAGVVENNDLRYNAFGAFWKSNDCTTRYVGNQE